MPSPFAKADKQTCPEICQDIKKICPVGTMIMSAHKKIIT